MVYLFWQLEYHNLITWLSELFYTYIILRSLKNSENDDDEVK